MVDVEEPEGAVKVKSWPVPLRATLCGLPAALSEMLMVPVLVPAAVGLKVTEIVQLAPALTVVPQVLVWEKSPLAVMPEMVSEALPVLVRMTVCAVLVLPDIWAVKVREAGDKPTTGSVPVPVSGQVWGLFAALSEIVRVPERVPIAVGVKDTLIVQLAPGATLAPQVFDCEKSPLIAMLLMVSAAVPVLVSVTVSGALAVLSGWLGKSTGPERLTTGANPEIGRAHV